MTERRGSGRGRGGQGNRQGNRQGRGQGRSGGHSQRMGGEHPHRGSGRRGSGPASADGGDRHADNQQGRPTGPRKAAAQQSGPRKAGPLPARSRTSTDRARPSRPRSDSPQINPKGERIAKLLARAGVGSRRDIERMIEAGRIAIGGEILTTPATILTSLDQVTIDGQPAPAIESSRVFLFHKPVGVLTAARDMSGRPTINDVLPPGLPRLMPVGRLDLNTEGLLLLTNDGELKRALELPLNEVPRSYRVRALGSVHQSRLDDLAGGITIDGMRYGSVDASLERRARADGANIWLSMTLREGKNREVRRLCEALGLRVSRLIRTSYGPFALADLPVRAVIEVPAAEVSKLKRSLGNKHRQDA